MSKDNLFENVKTEAAERLLADTFFVGIPVLSDVKEGNLGDEIAKALAGSYLKAAKKGAAVIITALDASEFVANTPSPVMTLSLVIDLFEIPSINRGSLGTGKTAAEILARVSQCLHMATGAAGTFHVESVTDLALGAGVGYRVTFEMERCGFGRVAKAGPVTIVQDAGEVTLSCATDSAEIYYSTELSGYPDTLYSAPFTPDESATILRAAARKADLIPGDIATVAVQPAV